MRSKHQKYLYVAAAGHYHAADDAERMRAERIEGLVSQKHANGLPRQRSTPPLAPVDYRLAQEAGCPVVATDGSTTTKPAAAVYATRTSS